jgi:hypothetical protein
MRQQNPGGTSLSNEFTAYMGGKAASAFLNAGGGKAGLAAANRWAMQSTDAIDAGANFTLTPGQHRELSYQVPLEPAELSRSIE